MSTPQSVQDTTSWIAIVGTECRLPGAPETETFWDDLCAGRELVRELTDEELIRAGADPALIHDPDYVRRRAVLENVDQFDAGFFGYAPRQAELMDPQQRHFLECAWTALERCGYLGEEQRVRIGVFAGCGINTYLLNNIAADGELIRGIDYHQLLTASEKEFLTSRVSYKLNLEGPSVTVSTACSSSLVAMHLACQSLLNGECDMALAGGVSIPIPQEQGFLYQEGGILARDGRCRTFDEKATGIAAGSGVALVVLKRYADAVAARDRIYAVIRGSAINNDGARKAGFTAPGAHGQAQVISEALAVAGVDARTIGYVEAHGTGTPLGDPIEVAALTQAFRAGGAQGRAFCPIGSVKTNVGHLDAAAGAIGLVKAALAIHHKTIPPTLNFERANPEIDFASSPFFVNTELMPWAANGFPRRAAVSSFGLGGTNAHVILEEAPPPSNPWHRRGRINCW